MPAHWSKEQKIDLLKAAVRRHAAGEGRGHVFDAELEAQKLAVKRRALLLLDQRARSVHELRSRLSDAVDCPPEIIDMVIDDLTHSGLLDDEAFAAQWVSSRFARRGKSPSVLDKELRDKGIAQPVRQAALEQISDEDQHHVARSLAEKKARTVTCIPDDRAAYDKVLRRIVGVLARRGFPADMSMSIARSALDKHLGQLGT